MNERAFNLFTALLALILIILTSILVTSMVQSESNTKTIIAKLMGQTKLESMSRLIRADAFQTFNYMMRYQIEGWLSHPDNAFLIAEHSVWEDWQKVIDEFANVQFRDSTAFARYLGENLPSQLVAYNDEYAAGYRIEVDFNREGFIEILQSVVEDSAADHDFFEVIDCEGTPETCPIGSFYINLKFSRLDQKAYESMPLVTVTDIRSGRMLRDPVLPRNDLKVYVPLRLFRALAIARKLMHSDLDNINSSDDHGFYSPRFHNEIDSMALGLCDYGYCAPRKNPYFPPPEKYLEQNCPGYVGVSSYNVEDGEFRGESFSYNAARGSRGVGNMQSEMKKLVKKRLCELSVELIGEYDGEEQFEVLESGADCYISKDDIQTDTTPAKKIEPLLLGAPSRETGPTYTIDDEPNHFETAMPKCPFNFSLPEHRRIGMYRVGTETHLPDQTYGSEVCEGFGSIPDADDSFLESCQTSSALGMWACCTEITQVSFVVAFEEMNPDYKINKERDVRYSIAAFNIGYSPFNPNYDFGGMDSSCAFTSIDSTRSCSSLGWTCQVPSGGGCYPV